MDEKIKRINWLAKHGYAADFDSKMAAKNYSINTRNTILIFGKCFEKEVEKACFIPGLDGAANTAGEITEAMVEQFLIKHPDPLNRWALKKYFVFKGFNRSLISKIAGRNKQRLPKWIYKTEVYSIANALPLKDNLICRLLFEGGMRVSEVRNLKVLNFNFNDKIIRFIGKGNKERIVRFTEETKQMLMAYISKLGEETYEHSKIFPARSREHITRIIKKEAIKQLGRPISAHTLRHSCATHLLTNGMNLRMIQEYLGHASINTTTVYTHITRGDLDKKWTELMEREAIEPDVKSSHNLLEDEFEPKEVIDAETEKIKHLIQETFI